MSRVRAADAALSREQHAFFSKYGIGTSDGVEQQNVGDIGSHWECKFRGPNYVADQKN